MTFEKGVYTLEEADGNEAIEVSYVPAVKGKYDEYIEIRQEDIASNSVDLIEISLGQATDLLAVLNKILFTDDR